LGNIETEPHPGNLDARVGSSFATVGTEGQRDVRRLLEAALEVMRRCGTMSRPRVADIVEEAGLSNDAFYRYFPSKDALVQAILEDGADRLCSYLGHQMAKESTPAAKVRAWVEGVLAQAEGSPPRRSPCFGTGGVSGRARHQGVISRAPRWLRSCATRSRRWAAARQS